MDISMDISMDVSMDISMDMSMDISIDISMAERIAVGRSIFRYFKKGVFLSFVLFPSICCKFLYV